MPSFRFSSVGRFNSLVFLFTISYLAIWIREHNRCRPYFNAVVRSTLYTSKLTCPVRSDSNHLFVEPDSVLHQWSNIRLKSYFFTDHAKSVAGASNLDNLTHDFRNIDFGSNLMNYKWKISSNAFRNLWFLCRDQSLQLLKQLYTLGSDLCPKPIFFK